MYTYEFEAIGTHWQIDIYGDAFLEKVKTKIQKRIAQFDAHYSRFRADSLVTLMSQKAGMYLMPDDAEEMLGLYEKVFRITEGAVTPLIGQVLVDAGYDAEYSLVPKTLTRPKQWDEVLSYSHPTLTLSEPALLDFGAAGKGYLIDIVGELLESEGIMSYCIDAGGDMRQRSMAGEVLRVGLEHPEHTEQAIGIAYITNRSLCGSAGNRRVWGDFHHIIDPHMLSSPRHILAVWAVADTTLLADMLTTALFFVSPEVLQTEFDFEYVILHADHSVTRSPDFPGEIFGI